MKRLIACSDGTWDKPGAKSKNGKSLDSNVCLFFDAVSPTGLDGASQLKVYDTGIGTGYSLKDKFWGGGIGEGIDKKIKNIYLFLVLTYEPGDDIFLFGFSRGAYTARSLAGMIRNCGILKPDHVQMIDKAYELYRDRNDFTAPDSDLMRSFRSNYSHEDVTRIKFIGVWDTVGSLGIPLPAWRFYNKGRYKFHDVTLSSSIDYAYQALAIDERRKPFAPALWQMSESKDKQQTIEMEQRWFAGVHCNVGGGYEDRGLSNNTLNWIASKAIKCGLALDQAKLDNLAANFEGKIYNSFTFPFWLTGRIWRTINDPEYPNQYIDESVKLRLKQRSYRPENLKGTDGF